MDYDMTRGEENLLLLESIISSNEKLYVWCYNENFDRLASTCPTENEELLAKAFSILGANEKLQKITKNIDYSVPFLIGSSIGMQWAVTFENERKQSLIFVIGPVFYTAPSEQQLRTSLRPFIDTHEIARWSRDLIAALPRMPVMPYAIFSRYVMLVHNTLTGKQLGPEVLGFVNSSPEDKIVPVDTRNREKVWLSERAMLQMVRNGDINYHTIIQRSIDLSPGVPVKNTDPLRQAKTSIVVFTTLVSRAAMEAGLSPEVAYAVGDSYLQAVEDSKDSGELSALADAMYHDFIYRVHYLRTNPGYSHEIQKCCDYIELSLDRKIRVSEMASLVGYSEYYLTEKFKKETGMSVSQYIRHAKVKRAQVLLESTDMSVREISENLAFNTVNYFIQSFRETTGCTPAQYRKKRKAPQ